MVRYIAGQVRLKNHSKAAKNAETTFFIAVWTAESAAWSYAI